MAVTGQRHAVYMQSADALAPYTNAATILVLLCLVLGASLILQERLQ